MHQTTDILLILHFSTVVPKSIGPSAGTARAYAAYGYLIMIYRYVIWTTLHLFTLTVDYDTKRFHDYSPVIDDLAQ